ncbi:EF-hand domain-containing protein, partial [Blastomonas sp.]|uniref:EF-hand domain-containing protein n=1 Tax=Blastomonas sp. TaxID=1909299 RepID=UPI0035936C2C
LTAGTAMAQPAPGMARGMAAIDTNGDGIITEDEVRAHARARFAKMDANGDGKLDKADREARQAANFAKMDTDGSGEVSQAEMQAAREARQAKRAERLAKWGQQANVGEAGAKRGKWGGKRGGGMRMMRMAMMRADTNKDGAISLAEFEAAAVERFRRIDTNGDGQVTQAEREAARETMKQRWQERRGGNAG